MQIHTLAQTDGPERIDAGTIRSSFPKQSEARTSPSDLGQHRRRATKFRACAERTADGEKQQPALLGFIDHFERDTRPTLDAVEEDIAVLRLSDGTRRDGPHVRDSVAINQMMNPFEGGQRRVDGARRNDAGRKGIASE